MIMNSQELEQLTQEFPFLCTFWFQEEPIIGIVQNSNAQFIHIYCYNLLVKDQNKKEFIQGGNQWWWESNRTIPIHLFLREDWNQFKNILRVFPCNSVSDVKGHLINLNETYMRRIKRKQTRIQLIEPQSRGE